MKRDFVIVGSQAIKFYYRDFPRVPHDTDIIVTREKYLSITEDDSDIEMRTASKTVPVECIDSVVIRFRGIATPFEYLISDGVKSLELILDQLCTTCEYASPQVLYSLKKAHIHFPIKFDKHIQDLMFLRGKLREQRGINLTQDLSSISDLLEEFPALTEMHFQETEKRRGKLKTPKMNQTTEDFFGKSKKYVTSYYIHDNMHMAMAHDQDPIYLRLLKLGSEVETDLELWKALSVQERIWCVMEEVYVIALERKILPQLFEEIPTKFDAKSAFDWALMRVCTTLCDGFFRDFAVRAYDEIQKQYDPEYINTFFKNIDKYEQPDRTIPEFYL